VLRVAPCYAYRDQRPAESQAQYTQRLLDELEATIQAAGPASVIGGQWPRAGWTAAVAP